MKQDLPRRTFKPGNRWDNLRASEANAMMDALRKGHSFTVGGQAKRTGSVNGAGLFVPPKPKLSSFVGKVVSEGPTGQDDFADERYWIRREYAGTEDDKPKWRNTPEALAGISGAVVEAVHLGELETHTHGIPPDTHVNVFHSSLLDGSGPVVYFFQFGAVSAAVRYKFKSQFNDHLVCRQILADGSESPVDTNVAKPLNLQVRTYNTKINPDGWTQTSTGVSTRTLSKSGQTSELQQIIPKYGLDNEIAVIPANTGVTILSLPVGLMEVSGREWAEVFTE
jgi:hypothetical protein